MSSPAFRIPFARDEGFAGRAAELASLHEHLQNREIVTIRPARDCGGCGSGVTALAVEYAYRHRADHPGGIFWATPEDRSSPFYPRAFDQPFSVWDAPDDAISLLTSWSALTRSLGPDALLIVDAGALSAPTASFAAPQHRVVILTELHDLTLRSPTIEVGPLDEEAASAYLLPSVAHDRVKAAALARALASLPLTLHLARGHLATHPDLTVDDYLASLPVVDAGTTCGAILKAVFQSAWASIDGTAAGALLQTLSALTPGAFSPPRRLELLAGSLLVEDGAVAPIEAVLAQLHARGFTAQRTDGSVSLHPRLGALVRGTVPDLEAFCRARAAALLAAHSDPGCLARETLARGTKSTADDLFAARGLLEPTKYGCEIAGGLTHLASWLVSTARPDQDRPATRARFLQQLAVADDPYEPEPPALRARAEALLAGEDEPHLRLRHGTGRRRHHGFRSDRDRILSAAITADGAAALTANREGGIAIRDALTSEVIRTVACANDGIVRAGLAADGLVGVTAPSSHRSVVAWDLTSGQSFHEIPIVGGAQLRRLSMTPDGRVVVATTSDQMVTVVDLRDPGKLRRRTPPQEEHRRGPDEGGALVSANGQRILWPRAAGRHSERRDDLWVWDLTRDTEWTLTLEEDTPPPATMWTRRFHRHRGSAHGAVSADGRRAFTVSPSERLVLWDLDDPGPPRFGADHLGEVLDLACTADGAFVVVVSRLEAESDRGPAHEWTRLSLQIREGSSGALVSELLRSSLQHEACLALALDGRAMVLVDDDLRFLDWITPPAPAHRT